MAVIVDLLEKCLGGRGAPSLLVSAKGRGLERSRPGTTSGPSTGWRRPAPGNPGGFWFLAFWLLVHLRPRECLSQFRADARERGLSDGNDGA